VSSSLVTSAAIELTRAPPIASAALRSARSFEIYDQNLRALVDESFRRSATDTARASGDYRHATIKLAHIQFGFSLSLRALPQKARQPRHL
jgi:hypothetical protein